MHPILFRFGPFHLYSYGLMLAVGFLTASALASRRAAAAGLDPNRIQTLSLVVLVAGLIGARSVYVILNWELFRSDPLEILRLDHGGLVFYGGLAAGLLAGLSYIRKAALPLLRTVDLMIPPLVIAHAIGRLGCFFNGCCYGKPTSLPWAFVFLPDGLPRHPTQLYESGALLLIFFVLKNRERGRAAPGVLLLTYGFLYGAWRFCVEFLRGDNPILAWNLTLFQWISLPLAMGCGLLLWMSRRRAAPHRP